MKRLKTSLRWLDKHILKILVVAFIIIIPLYPKLPFRIVNYTYVAIRLEDFYMVFVGLVFAVQFFRKKVDINWKMFLLFAFYWIAVFASYLYGHYVLYTIEINNIGFLHSLRRIEYMLIFFVAYTTIKSKKDLYFYLKILTSVLAFVSIYSFGQKFLGWPAVQTMNPEYAKGYILVLDSWSRVSSTFAGHYDFSAYLLLLMPVIIGLYLATKKRIYFVVFTLALAALVLAASRASFLAFLITLTLFLPYVRKFKLYILIIVMTAILTPLSDNLANRLTRTFQPTKVFVDIDTGQTLVARDMQPDELPPGDFGSKSSVIPPSSTVIIDPETKIAARKAIRENLIEEAKTTGKVYTAEELEFEITRLFNRQVTVVKYLPDISISTRLQVSWPRAIAAFLSNIWLGTGTSSLGEATDGDYFRWFGENGLLGTIPFLTILFVILRRTWLVAQSTTKKYKYIFYGFAFGFIGLFINAGYIDLFEASKLAYTFWCLAGIFFAASPFFMKKVKTSELKIS